MAIKLQIRRDTLANWTSNQTVVLLTGEIGYVTDTRNMKIGDGTTQWQYLKYQAPYYTGTNSSLLTTTLSVDQTNNRVGIGTITPATTLDIAGQTRLRAGGTYAAPTDNAAVLNYDATGGILTVDARNSSGTTNIAFHASNSGTGGERVRIRSAGNVLDTNGIITSNRTTAGTFVVSGDGAYSFGSDTKQYIYGKPGNSGNVVVYTTDSSGNTNSRLQVNENGAQVTGALTTSTTATIGTGLGVTSGGVTITAGGLTVTAGSVSVPSGSINGVAITANTLAPSKITNLAAAGVLGATGAGAVTALTSGLGGTAQTALGLGSNAYLAGMVISSSTSWVDLAVSATGTVNKNFNVSDLVIGQPTLIPLQFARASNSAVLNANLVLTSTDIVTIISASDAGTTNTSWGTTAASNQCAWWRRSTAIAGDLDYPGPITLSGTQTFLVFKWYQVSGNNTNGPRAYVYVVRQQ